MPLSYHPSPGEVVVCHHDDVVIEPDGKTRPVIVVVSPPLRNRSGLVTVVPLSTTMPARLQDFLCRIEFERLLPPPFDAPVAWAKCDMVGVVSLDRLDRFKEPRSRYGGRRKKNGRAGG